MQWESELLNRPGNLGDSLGGLVQAVDRLGQRVVVGVAHAAHRGLDASLRASRCSDCNDLTLMGALSGCEMGLKLSGVKLAGSGVAAAMDYFAGHPSRMPLQKAA